MPLCLRQNDTNLHTCVFRDNSSTIISVPVCTEMCLFVCARANVCAGLHAWLPDMAGVKELLEMVDSGLQKNAAEEVLIAGVCVCACIQEHESACGIEHVCVCVCGKGGFGVGGGDRWVSGWRGT